MSSTRSLRWTRSGFSTRLRERESSRWLKALPLRPTLSARDPIPRDDVLRGVQSDFKIACDCVQEKIVEIMRDPVCESRHGFQAARSRKRLFAAFALDDVEPYADTQPHPRCGAASRTGPYGQKTFLSRFRRNPMIGDVERNLCEIGQYCFHCLRQVSAIGELQPSINGRDVGSGVARQLRHSRIYEDPERLPALRVFASLAPRRSLSPRPVFVV